MTESIHLRSCQYVYCIYHIDELIELQSVQVLSCMVGMIHIHSMTHGKYPVDKCIDYVDLTSCLVGCKLQKLINILEITQDHKRVTVNFFY